jgi:hypothetical protein
MWRKEHFDAARLVDPDIVWGDECNEAIYAIYQMPHFDAPGNALCLSYHPHRASVHKSRRMRSGESKVRMSAMDTFHDDASLRKIISRAIAYRACVDDALIADECFFFGGSW